MKDSTMIKWFRIGVFNLAIVALYGTLMRYKIVFDFPFLEQKNLLHAHSHFAFNGWISHFLYSGLALIMSPYLSVKRQKLYNSLILFNILCSFGMLFSFTLQGYKLFSIVFSTLSVVQATLYMFVFIKDRKLLPIGHRSKPWAVAGLILNVVSALGPFYLAYMLMTANLNTDFYLASVYYFLHFQYSGWFFFGCMAIVANMLPSNFPSLRKHFLVFAITVVPTYGLSVLWAKLPNWLYVIVVAATFVQLLAWISLAWQLWKYFRPQIFKTWMNSFFFASAIALTLKFILQAISVVPSLSQLVFGIRPIVIAYLHLVLLGVYSLFIPGYLFQDGWIKPIKIAKISALLFLVGVLLNELLLGIQGFTAFAYIPVPYINELLFTAAVILFGSSLTLAISQKSGR